jgi:hypothetical protein
MQVAAANCRAPDLHQRFAAVQLRYRKLFQQERLAGAMEDSGACGHDFIVTHARLRARARRRILKACLRGAKRSF